MRMYNLLIVAFGGAIGAGLRYLANLSAVRLFGAGFPWGTLGINITGSFFMGLYIEILSRRFGGSQELRLFVTTGVLGGFTTFSAFSLDFANLFERGQIIAAVGYAIGSVVFSLIAVFTGLWVARHFA
jgi:fluoride exporter